MRSSLNGILTCVALLLPAGGKVHAQDGLDFLFEPPAADAEPAASGEGEDGAQTSPDADAASTQSAEDGNGQPSEPHAGAQSDAAVATIDIEPLRAQAEPPDAGASTGPKGRVIEEVVVTAQKRAQSLQDVPISVSAIAGEQLKDAAVTDAQELVQYTPNVKFSQGANFLPTINIRGFGSPPLGRNLEPSVGLSIDDVFYGRSTFAADGIFDVERVEVLRGPQGTLFGKNTIAGVLNFTTAQPSYDTDGFITLAGGSESERRAEGGLGFGLIDDVLAMRVSFRARERDTGMYNTYLDQTNDSRDVAGRVKLRWDISDHWRAELTGLRASSRTTGTSFELQQASERSLARYRQIDPDADDEPYNGRQSINEPSFSDRDAQSLSLKLGWLADGVGFLSDFDTQLIVADARIETPYLIDTDFSPIDSQSITSEGPERYRQRSFELRTSFASPGPFGIGAGMQWIAGVFGLDSAVQVTQFATINLNGVIDSLLAGGAFVGRAPQSPEALRELLGSLGLPTDISELPAPITLIPEEQANDQLINRVLIDSRTLALFFQTTWALTDRFDLTLGYRYGREDKDGEQSSQCINRPVCSAASIFAGQRNFSNVSQRSETERSPKIAVSYRLHDEITVFANATRGFKSGGYSGPLIAPTNLEYEPEEALSMEAGIKSRLLGGSLMLNATAYRVEFDDLQVNLFDGTNISTLNAASAVSRGVEVDFQWLPPIEALTLAGSFGLTDVAYGNFPCGPAIAGDTDTSPECNPDNDPQPPPTQDLTGRETPFTPKMTASFTPTLRFPLWPRFDLGGILGVDVLYQGEQYLDADLDPASFQEATTKINARLGIGPGDRRWSVLFNAKNLTGERERAILLDQPQFAGNYVTIAYPDEPMYALDVRYTFGE